AYSLSAQSQAAAASMQPHQQPNLREVEMCSFCGDNPVQRICSEPSCSRNRLCKDCSVLWHGHPNRKDHRVHDVNDDKNSSHYNMPPQTRIIQHRAKTSESSIQRHKSCLPQERQSSTMQRTSSGAQYDTLAARAQTAAEAPAAIGGGVEWQCEHCTFMNSSARQAIDSTQHLLCEVCYKTTDRRAVATQKAPMSFDSQRPVQAPQQCQQPDVVLKQPQSVDSALARENKRPVYSSTTVRDSNGFDPMSQQQSQTNYSRQHEANGQSVNQDVLQPQYAQQQQTQSSSLSSAPKTSYEQSRDQKHEPSPDSATDNPPLQAVREEPQVQHRLRQETFQQIRNMKALDTEKELLLRLVQDPKFCRFRLDDLVKAVQSGGDLAYEDEFMLAYLCSKCQKCEKPEPRHYQVCMAQCSCQLCFDCFRKFVFECLNPATNISPSRFSCPGCQQPKPDDVEHFATHINFLSLQLEQIGETCSWVSEAVITEFERTSDECCRELSIKISKFSDTLSSTQPAYERLNAKGFYCPECQCFFPSSKSTADHIACYSCKHSFCPCCNTASSIMLSSHEKQCFFKSKNVSISVLQFILKESKIPFDKTARRRRNKSSSERGGRKIVDEEWRCSAIDFKHGGSGSGGFLQCENRVYKKVCVCERHYKEYLLDLINENNIVMENVCSSLSAFKINWVKRGRYMKNFFKSLFSDG
ncbi:hypothetical protein BOX15_Mlig012393g2, partial [Macrostomum lignano]